MVSVHNKHGIFPHVIAIHHIQHAPQRPVAHAQQGKVLFPDFPHKCLVLTHHVVGRPVIGGGLLIDAVFPLEFLRCGKWLMGIKSFNLQKPIVVFPVILNEFNTLVKHQLLRIFALTPDVFAIHCVIVPGSTHNPGIVTGHTEAVGILIVTQVSLPGVVFLPTVNFPRRVAGMIGGAAVLPIVVVIRNQMGIDPVFFQNFRNAVVPWFNRPPAAVEKADSAGMEIPPRRHTGKTSHIAGIERDGFFPQAFKIGADCLRTAVVRQCAAVERVIHDHNCAHM